MERSLQTIVTAHTIKGTSFVGIRDYESSKEEISNQTILVGADYSKAKSLDIETARNFDINSYESPYSETVRAEAKVKILESLTNPRTANSEGQKEAYEHVGKGLKIHKEKGELYVYGFLVAKTVIKPGVYKATNSKELTLAKKEMIKKMDLRTSKYRQF
jgi:hypothetical protein